MVGWNPNSAGNSLALSKLFNSKSLSFLVYKVVKKKNSCYAVLLCK